MGFFKKFVFRSRCREIMAAYVKIKKQNPSLSQEETYRQLFLLKPNWKEFEKSFYKGMSLKIIASGIIFDEFFFSSGSSPEDFDNICEMHDIVDDEFKDFQE